MGIDSAEDFVADAGSAASGHADAAGGGAGKVEDPPPHKRSAIVDADDDGPAVTAVGDAQLGAEAQGAMGGRQPARIHPFSGCGAGVQRIPGGPSTTIFGESRSRSKIGNKEDSRGRKDGLVFFFEHLLAPERLFLGKSFFWQKVAKTSFVSSRSVKIEIFIDRFNGTGWKQNHNLKLFFAKNQSLS
jgi:hypothetical protein